MKSEQLKSGSDHQRIHDIKTPLTSIINYVDLLKRKILKTRSERLYPRTRRKITAPETADGGPCRASKSQLRNIKLEFMNLNLNELVQQVNGEFAERFEGRNLDLRSVLQPEPLYDPCGQPPHLARAENLYVNKSANMPCREHGFMDAIKKTERFSSRLRTFPRTR